MTVPLRSWSATRSILCDTRHSRTTNPRPRAQYDRSASLSWSAARSGCATRHSRTTNLVRERERELEPPVDDDVQHGAVRAEERRRVAADRGLATARGERSEDDGVTRKLWRFHCGGSMTGDDGPMVPFVTGGPRSTGRRSPLGRPVNHQPPPRAHTRWSARRRRWLARLAALGHDRAAADRDRVARRRPPAEPAHGRLDARARQRDEVAVRLEEEGGHVEVG